jgi:trigger factor
MENELKKALSTELKESVLDALYEGLKITLPKALVDREIQSMRQPYLDSMAKQEVDVENINLLPRDMFEENAKKRVGLGLVLSEIIQKNALSVTDEKLQLTLKELAQNYDSPEEAIAWYQEDKTRFDEIKQIALEEETVQWLTHTLIMTDDEPQKFHELVSKRFQKQQQN